MFGRLCWWCNRRLVSAGDATARDVDGNPVRVHKSCAPDVEEYVRKTKAGCALGQKGDIENQIENIDERELPCRDA